MNSIIEISYLDVLLATGFIIVAALLSLLLNLELLKSLFIATLRTYLQLFALGFALRWIFGIDSVLLVIGALILMSLVAVQTLMGRVTSAPRGLFFRSWFSLGLSSITVLLAVTGVVIGVSPWYEPHYVIPLGGMIIGNSMNGIGVAVERLFSDLKARSEEIQMMLALGAAPWEASQPSVRTAVKAGLIPTINSMNAVGIVFIPGIMTGQILSGVDPLLAAQYQIVIMLMLSAATALGTILALMLTYQKAFDIEGRFTGSDLPT